MKNEIEVLKKQVSEAYSVYLHAARSDMAPQSVIDAMYSTYWHLFKRLEAVRAGVAL